MPTGDFPNIPLWPMPQGWMCPNCGSAHAPSVLTCPRQVTCTITTTFSGDAPQVPTTGSTDG
jgi:hypothetical protein